MRCTARSSIRSPTTPAPSRESLSPCWRLMLGTAVSRCGSHRTILDPGAVGATMGTLLSPWGSAQPLPCRDSCQKGWRLLYILTAYYKCSEVLRPFLMAFLRNASMRPELPQGCHPHTNPCEQNLRKTLQFGGRRLFPSSMELKAMVAGRSAKRQLFLLPGGIERHLKIKTCSVRSLEITGELCRLCCEMGLQRPEALDEYILFVVTNRGEGPMFCQSDGTVRAR
uniref:MyTH4 domain-containing protein n=1 Tax=Coturnix japonica TaxID=93934 RepID=A0A8C2SQX5_COTJA